MEREKRIGEWLADRSVLVTGGTGFMGKVLVEKLLRSCPKIRSIYILIRPKRGLQVAERLKHLLSLSLFDEVRKTEGQLEKVEALESDATLPVLGLSEEDQAIVRERVSVIFHSAATVKFDEQLREAVAINLVATKNLIKLAHTMSKLEVMVHISTAYCNCQKLDVAEQVYPMEIDPEKVINMVQTLDSELLESLTPKLLGCRPNTYTFTKALAEQIVNEQNGILPIAIVRPSIVTASWKEPVPGWVDNLNGPTGLLVGAGKGVLRSLLCDRECICDFIPVDIAINFCIAAAYFTAVNRPNNIVVYNCTTGAKNPIRWKDLETWGQEYITRYPASEVLWYPGGSFKKHWMTNMFATYMYMRIPAHIMDFLARVTGNKPIMVRIQDKLAKATKALEFFTMREFRFENDNMMAVWKSLNPEDKEVFNFDILAIDWKSYLETYVLGTRTYILKEDPKNIPQARRSLFWMYLLHKLTQFSIVGVVVWLLYSKSRVTVKVLLTVIGLLLKTVKRLKIPLTGSS